MAACLPFSATFLVFSDYMKPSIRLGALSKLKAFYVFTHDSIGVGEDGPTHEPIEQFAGLRAIPGLSVIRPADATEAAEAWTVRASSTTGQRCSHSRGKICRISTAGSERCRSRERSLHSFRSRGGRPEVILIGTGSEVALCVKAQERLKGYGVKARVVSMPSWNLFEAQDAGLSGKRSSRNRSRSE